MILIDLNQVMVSNLMIHLKNNAELNEDLVRHMILNNIRAYKQKFSEYGELVICCDDINYWRKDLFSYYKAHRKRDRDNSNIDWNMIFNCINTVREEIKEYMPYKTLQVERAEADDLIAALVKMKGFHLAAENQEQIMIVSGDKDFAQLQIYINVKQFSPNTKRYVKINNPKIFLKEHIIRGDRGDGVPNILSDDDCIMIDKRQKSISTKKLENWLNQNPEDFCDKNMLRKYKRNEKLVDLSLVPKNIIDEAIHQYQTYEIPQRSGIFNYFAKKGLVNLLESINEF